MKRVRYYLALLLVLFVAPKAMSQDVIYSPYDKFDFRNGEYAVVGMTGGYLYNYRNSVDGAMLDAFDDSMNKVATVILDFFPVKIYQTRFIACQDHIVVLYQALESNKVVQYAALLDERARLKGKPVQIGSVKTGIFGAMKNYFYSAVSDDKKTVLIYSVTNKGNSLEFDGKWLDDSLKITKHSHCTFDAGQKLSFGELNISNEGTAYMAAYTEVGVQNYADAFWILQLTAGATKFEERKMELGEKYAASGYMKLDNVNNRVYFGGYYSNKKNGSYQGIIFAAMDMHSGSWQNLKFIPFDNALEEAAGMSHSNHAFDNYQVRQLIVKNDGGFVMVSEVHYITTRTNYAPGLGYYSSFYSPYNSTMIREFHFNDIMAISYDKDGNRQWHAFVPKEQYSQEDGGAFASYLMLNSGGSLAFLFNDFNAKRSRIQLASLDPGGEMQINSFTAEGNDSPDWLPKSGKQVAARILIVPCLHKRQICFAKVVF